MGEVSTNSLSTELRPQITNSNMDKRSVLLDNHLSDLEITTH